MKRIFQTANHRLVLLAVLLLGGVGVARQTKASDHYPVWAVFSLEYQK